MIYENEEYETKKLFKGIVIGIAMSIPIWACISLVTWWIIT